MNAESSVAILMCTYNGGKFLAEQLESILNQTHKNITLWISDDGSTDNTLEIIEQYKQKFGQNRLYLVMGPRKGCVANFLSLLCNPDITADYYAFADQDDIWYPEKTAIALEKVSKAPQDTPVLYGSRTETTDENAITIGYSKIFTKTPCFENALVQSIAGGNTMLMNHAAIDIARKAGPLDVIGHDWWMYMLISGVGGEVIFDEYPSLKYRQHGGNLTGANGGFTARLKRLNLLLGGNFSKWNDVNIRTLLQVKIC